MYTVDQEWIFLWTCFQTSLFFFLLMHIKIILKDNKFGWIINNNNDYNNDNNDNKWLRINNDWLIDSDKFLSLLKW